jgi:hypothetical protein
MRVLCNDSTSRLQLPKGIHSEGDNNNLHVEGLEYFFEKVSVYLAQYLIYFSAVFPFPFI